MKNLSFIFLMMITSGLFGQKEDNFPPPDTQIVVRAVQTAEDIQIDGQLDEASWQQAEVF